MNLYDYGFTDDLLLKDKSGMPARVISVFKGRFGLVCEKGETFGTLKTKEYYNDCEVFPTVGDFVLIDYRDDGDSRIIATLKRKSYFFRRDPDNGEQAIAANFDYVFIMQSLNADFNLRRLERYLAIALQSNATPVVILTKADIAENCEEYKALVRQIAPNIDICAVSSVTGFGMDSLSEYLKPQKTLVFLGSSGIGKSSLVNRLANREIMSVSGIRESDCKGRHTTTHRELIMLDNGVMIIDTPGMRELGVINISEGITDTFADISEYADKCRFSDCTHTNEPGCAVSEAIKSGVLTRERFESYRKLSKEAGFDKQKKRQWGKDVAKRKKSLKR